MSSYSGLRITIISFSFLILILFILILTISVIQYQHFKVVDGTAVCEEFVNRCILTFEYTNSMNEPVRKTSLIGFREINQEGIFQVKVAYRLKNDQLEEFFVIGSPYHVFLGTKNMVIIYSLLTLFSLVICLSFIPSFIKK